MKTVPFAVALLLTPVLALAQPWSAGLDDAMLRSTDKGDFHFQKANLREDNRDLIRLVSKTAPAIVMIGVTGKAPQEEQQQQPEGQDDQEMKDFEEMLKELQKHMQGEGQGQQQPPSPVQPQADNGPRMRIIPIPMPGAGQESRVVHGTGSGVIVSFGGHKVIVTNNHVVEIAGTGSEVDLKYFDGTMGKGTVLGRNERYDLAFVAPKELCRGCRALPMNTKVKEGEIVMALGAPFGLYETKTTGIVSFIGRDIEGQGGSENIVPDFIQTDAAINKGNSGGALVDIDGRLIGINTAIYSPTGGSVGIGFATPAKYVLKVAARYAATGVIAPSRIGLQVTANIVKGADDKPQLDRFGALVTGAVVVAADPAAGSPAAAAGFKKGDELVSLNGAPIKSHKAFVQAIADLVPGQKAVVVVKRGEQTLTISSDVASTHD